MQYTHRQRQRATYQCICDRIAMSNRHANVRATQTLKHSPGSSVYPCVCERAARVNNSTSIWYWSLSLFQQIRIVENNKYFYVLVTFHSDYSIASSLSLAHRCCRRHRPLSSASIVSFHFNTFMASTVWLRVWDCRLIITIVVSLLVFRFFIYNARICLLPTLNQRRVHTRWYTRWLLVVLLRVVHVILCHQFYFYSCKWTSYSAYAPILAAICDDARCKLLYLHS